MCENVSTWMVFCSQRHNPGEQQLLAPATLVLGVQVFSGQLVSLMLLLVYC